AVFGDDNKTTEANASLPRPTNTATPTPPSTATAALSAAGDLDATETPASGETEAAASGTHCGTERWPVKTLSDADVTSINLSPLPATVAQLDSLSAPSSLPQASRVAPVELTTYWVVAAVGEFKIEDDRDMHGGRGDTAE